MSQFGKKELLRVRRAYRAGVKRKREFYLSCGASEELCGELLAVDRKAYRAFMRDIRRRDDKNPEMLAADPPGTDFSGNEWLDDIESPRLHEALSALSSEDIELLGDYVFRGYKQREIARDRKMSQSCVSRKLGLIFSKIRFALACESENASPGADEIEGRVEKCPDLEDESGERPDEARLDENASTGADDVEGVEMCPFAEDESGERPDEDDR